MAGTKVGGVKAAATNKRRHGKDFYADIGAIGGRNNRTGGFAAGEEGRERARKYGAIGGTKSKRTAREQPSVAETASDPEYTPEGMKRIVSVIPPHNVFYVYAKHTQ